AFLQLFEQPDVLNGDNRLVSEDFQKLDLFVGEGINLQAPEAYRAYCFPTSHKGRVHQCAYANRLYAVAGWRKHRIVLSANVMNMHGLPGPEDMLIQWFIGDWQLYGGRPNWADVSHETEHAVFNQAN